MTQLKIEVPPEKEKIPRNQICDFCKQKSVEPLIFMQINKIENYFCKKCHEWVCANLVNKGGNKCKTT